MSSKSFTTLQGIVLFIVVLSAKTILAQTPLGQFTSIDEIQSVGEQVYFVADDGIHGTELWVTNGSNRDIRLVKDITPGYSGSSISSLMSFKGDVYFSAYDKVNGAELWKSDGTPDGTILLKNIKPNSNKYNNGSNPNEFIVFNEELYFTASDDGEASDLWKTDGTEQGTIKVLETNRMRIVDFCVVENNLFITNAGGLWKLNKITNAITDFSVDDYFLREIHKFNNLLVCITSRSPQVRLYIFDPSTDEFMLLKEFAISNYGDQEIGNFTEVNDIMFFSVRTDYESDQETDVLWKTDGTANGTVPVKSFAWDRHWSNSFMQNFISFNDALFFRGSSGVSNYLYKSDGTESGTLLIKEVDVDEYVKPVVSGNKFYFAGNYGTLWESDGTSSGTTSKYPAIDLLTYTNPTVLYDVKGVVYFKGSDRYGLGLWNNVPNSQIEVTQGYKNLGNNEELQFDSKVDSLSTHSFKIKNVGEKELSISSVSVTGNGFYLNGQLSQFIYPGETASFNLIHYPFSEGTSKDILKINSNDENENVFTISLTSVVEGFSNSFKSDLKDLVKEIVPGDENTTSLLKLEHTRIKENSGPDAKIGVFTIDGQEDFEISFIQGEGDRDNSLFSLEGNELRAITNIDFEKSSSFNIRVKGTVTSTNESFERPFVIEVENLNEDVVYSECEETITYLSYALNGVQYIDQNTVIAIGESGVIMRSEDSGTSWEQINSGTRGRLNNIQFVDNEVGYIVGDYGIILKSENAGEDWFPLDIPNQEYPYLSNLHFIDKNTGHVFGGEGKIFKTEDGGITWKEKTYGYDGLISADFINEKIGFICGRSSTLIKTENGGDSWSSINVDGLGWNVRFVDIQFVSEAVGFMAGGGGEIYKTSDEGATWQHMGSFPTDYATDIYFVDESDGYATGGWSGSNIYKTQDGGATWVAQKEASYYQNTISFDFSPDNSKACAVGYGSSIGSTGENGRTIFTMNKDKWTLHSSLPEAGRSAVSFINDTVAFIFGQEAFKTIDSGLTWNKVDIQNSQGISESFFLNQNTGYAIGGDDVYKTANGGDTWTTLKIEVADASSLRNIYFFDENLGFVFGWGNIIYRTTDGGNTWLKISEVTTNYSIGDMVFLSSSKGFAVSGNPAKILKTEDGGLSWEPLNSFYLESLYIIDFLDENYGIALGSNGFQLVTNDGGETWDEVETGVGYNFLSTYFTSAMVGYAACNNGGGIGAILKTEDAGASWSLIMQSDELYDVAGFNNQLLFVGERGTLFSIADSSIPTIPGPVFGPATVSVDGSFSYSVAQSTNAEYRWEAEGNHKIEYSGRQAVITWNEPGSYRLKVTAFNSCGEGKSRSLTVEVEDSLAPMILGSDTVNANKTEMYYAQHGEKNRLTWNVDGAMNYYVSDDSINIHWADVESGSIELQEISSRSGARASSKMKIYIITGEAITGMDVEEMFAEYKVYPNPSSDFLEIDLEGSKKETISIRILDMVGKLYKTIEIDSSHDLRIDVRDLPPGLYLLELSTSGFEKNTRIIKK